MTPTIQTRFVSRLTRDTLALILAGGAGTRLGHLTRWHAKPAIPFGGKYRTIDFALIMPHTPIGELQMGERTIR